MSKRPSWRDPARPLLSFRHLYSQIMFIRAHDIIVLVAGQVDEVGTPWVTTICRVDEKGRNRRWLWGTNLVGMGLLSIAETKTKIVEEFGLVRTGVWTTESQRHFFVGTAPFRMTKDV